MQQSWPPCLIHSQSGHRSQEFQASKEQMAGSGGGGIIKKLIIDYFLWTNCKKCIFIVFFYILELWMLEYVL